MSVPRPTSRRGGAHAALLLAALVASVAATGCGGGSSAARSTRAGGESPAAEEPFTHEQRLVEQGARLVVDDGCSACHLTAGAQRIAPSFQSFAGHRVRLADGRSAIVDEAFVRRALTHPGELAIAGYDAKPMRAVLARTRLPERPHDVAALAAFIEQVGPEQ